MATVSYVPCNGWGDIFDYHKDNLRRVNYPRTLVGGNANIASVYGQYAGQVNGDVRGIGILHVSIEDNGTFHYIVRNEGGGGLHSEPNVLRLVQKRALAERLPVYFFSERAPCGGCQDALARWASTFDRDISVQFLVPWTDSDESIDVVSRAIGPKNANAAREAVRTRRALFR